VKKALFYVSLASAILAVPLVGRVQPPHKPGQAPQKPAAQPVQKPDAENFFAGLKVTRAPLVGSKGNPNPLSTEMKTLNEIFNETVADLEDRAIAYDGGVETEAGILDALERAITVVRREDTHQLWPQGPYRGVVYSELSGDSQFKGKLQVLNELSKFAEASRKTMARRAEDKKGYGGAEEKKVEAAAARARADLHRARALCLQINLEIWRMESRKQVVVGQMQMPPPRDVTPVP
jgi:hypothetical protein